MTKKNWSKRHDHLNLVHRGNELYAVFHQESFNEEFQWFRAVEEAEKEDSKNETVNASSSNEMDKLKQPSKHVFQSVDIRYKKK